MKTPVLVQLILPLLLFCAVAAYGGETSGEPMPVGILKTNDRIVEIHTGEHGPLYTVKTLNGESLGRHRSLEMLSQNFPLLGTLVKHGVADEANLYPHQPAASNTNSLNSGM